MPATAKSYNADLYRLVSATSLLVRFYLCYITIEQLPIFASNEFNIIVGQIVSVYSVFWAISYIATGIISHRLGIENPTGRSILYFMVYLIPVSIYWLVLLILTNVLHILPV